MSICSETPSGISHRPKTDGMSGRSDTEAGMPPVDGVVVALTTKRDFPWLQTWPQNLVHDSRWIWSKPHDLRKRVEAMGLEPTNLLTARLEPSALTAGHRPPNGQVSSAFASLPFNGERSVLVGE